MINEEAALCSVNVLLSNHTWLQLPARVHATHCVWLRHVSSAADNCPAVKFEVQLIWFGQSCVWRSSEMWRVYKASDTLGKKNAQMSVKTGSFSGRRTNMFSNIASSTSK